MKIKKVYVNAGHNEAVSASGNGPYDPGAVGATGLHEATVTLDVTVRVVAGLKAKGFIARGGIKESFAEGTANANAFGADVCLSIHCNAFTTKTARGIEVVVNKETPQKVAQALIFLEELKKATGFSAHGDGVYERPVKIVRDTRMPAFLLELGFISNPTEEAVLKSPANRQKVADAIVAAIIRLNDGK